MERQLIVRKQLCDEGASYFEDLKKVNHKALSFVQKNKVLYVLDRELYFETINSHLKD